MRIRWTPCRCRSSDSILLEDRAVKIGLGAKNEISRLPIEANLSASKETRIRAFCGRNCAVRCIESRCGRRKDREGRKEWNIIDAAELALPPGRTSIHTNIKAAPIHPLLTQ